MSILDECICTTMIHHLKVFIHLQIIFKFFKNVNSRLFGFFMFLQFWVVSFVCCVNFGLCTYTVTSSRRVFIPQRYSVWNCQWHFGIYESFFFKTLATRPMYNLKYLTWQLTRHAYTILNADVQLTFTELHCDRSVFSAYHHSKISFDTSSTNY